VVWVLKVPKKDAERVRKFLLRSGNLNVEWSIVEDGDYIVFPLVKFLDGAIEMDLLPRSKKLSPYDRIISLAKRRGIDIALPDFWEKLGDVLILPEWEFGEYAKEVGEIYANVLRAKTVLVYSGVSGEFRENKVRKIWGDGTETVHIENGIKYEMDVSRIMFSSGNVNERIRISRIDMSGDVVVDMFAGIGYFTLPAAKAGASRIYSCEKNPVAFYYLLRNRDLNGFSQILPLFGDNRVVCPEEVANRVIMGYFETLPFLEYGLKAIRDEGVIHYHDLAKDREADILLKKIKNLIRGRGFSLISFEKRVIKSYAPRVWHVVFDLHVARQIY